MTNTLENSLFLLSSRFSVNIPNEDTVRTINEAVEEPHNPTAAVYSLDEAMQVMLEITDD